MPTLKASYKKKSEIPEAHAALYIEQDGEFVLDAEGIDLTAKSKLDEFRKTNSLLFKALGIKASDKLEDILPKLEKLKTIDPDEYERLKTEAADAAEKKLTSKGQYEQALETQRKTMQADFDTKQNDLQKKYDESRKLIEKHLIENAVIAAATKKGVKATALLDVTARASRLFKLGDADSIHAFEGDVEKFGKDGKPLKPEEWVETLLTEAPHLFEANGGTGGGGGGGTGNFSAGNNPYKAGKTFNRTQQAKIENENPTLAKQLQAAANS